jgi:hypothetical protein
MENFLSLPCGIFFLFYRDYMYSPSRCGNRGNQSFVADSELGEAKLPFPCPVESFLLFYRGHIFLLPFRRFSYVHRASSSVFSKGRDASVTDLLPSQWTCFSSVGFSFFYSYPELSALLLSFQGQICPRDWHLQLTIIINQA